MAVRTLGGGHPFFFAVEGMPLLGSILFVVFIAVTVGIVNVIALTFLVVLVLVAVGKTPAKQNPSVMVADRCAAPAGHADGLVDRRHAKKGIASMVLHIRFKGGGFRLTGIAELAHADRGGGGSDG